MKKINFKKFSLLLCMIACMLTFTACTDQISTDDVKLSVKMNELTDAQESIKKWSVGIITYLDKTSDEDIKQDATAALGLGDVDGNLYIVNSENGMNAATVEFYNSWIKSRSELGSLVSIDKGTIQLRKDTGTLCSVTVVATYDKRQCTFEFVFDDDYNLTSGAINPTYTTSEKLGKAALNTVIGIGTVFVVLIFISFIISLFKYVNVIADKLSGTKASKEDSASSVDNAIAQIVTKEENEADDLELIAVITAAIAASEGTSSDGLVVRSIRKRR